jgi:hypothetical protein
MGFLERLSSFRESLRDADFIPAVAASDFVEEMERDYPEDLAEWMRANAVRFCTEALGDLLRGERRIAATRALPRAFAEAVAAGAEGNIAPLSAFSVVHRVNTENLRRAVADMKREDHLFVAGEYAASGNRALMLAEFHRAVARKCGRRCTRDVMSEATYVRLRDSILGSASPAEAVA